MFSNYNKTPSVRISDYEIVVNSPYRDMLLVQGTPLENEMIPLSGTLNFNIDDEFLLVKRISLRLVGKFKLEFMQIGTSSSSKKKKSKKGVAAIVKEKADIFGCNWNNLLLNARGDVQDERMNDSASSSNSSAPSSHNDNSSSNSDSNTNTNTTSTGSGSNMNASTSMISLNRFKLKRTSSLTSMNSGSSITVDIAPTTGETPVNDPDIINNTSNTIYYKLKRGHYSLPFHVMLPNDIPETVEGLQSASLLYTLESHIDRKHKKSASEITTSVSAAAASTGTSSSVINNNISNNSIFRRYKYLRVFRTISMNSMSIDEEMNVNNVLKDRLQYEIKIPSRAIPIGGTIQIGINIFPFIKTLKLNKISVSLLQYYLMKDLKGQVYDDEIVIFKKSMTQFGNLLLEDNRLFQEFKLNSEIQLPDNLRKLTQDCNIVNNKYIQVTHKLQFQIQLKRFDSESQLWKNIEIRANIPVLLYISPFVPMRGRLVLFDKQNGNIHFRSGEMVDLFDNVIINGDNGHSDPNMYHYYDDGAPPPTYEEYNKDPIIIARQHVAGIIHESNDATNNSTNNNGSSNLPIPSYEQAITSSATEDHARVDTGAN